MGAAKNKKARPRPRSRSLRKVLTWIAAAAAVTLVVYGLSQMSGVAYGEGDIRVVDFSLLTPAEKRSALQAANRARCPCGCGMNLAQCVATDSTCPIREENIRKIRTMVQQADQP